MESRGILYVAWGERAKRELDRSARSARQHNPGLGIALVVDGEPLDASLFDHVHRRQIARADRRRAEMKLDAIADAPRFFDRTVYLDTDTLVLGSLAPLFEVLDAFDAAMAHALRRRTGLGGREGIPLSFADLNTGVIAYRASSPLLTRWRKVLDDKLTGRREEIRGDQAMMRVAMWGSPDIRVATLPRIWNLPVNSPAYLEGEVVILHGHNENLESFARRVNWKVGPRLWNPKV